MKTPKKPKFKALPKAPKATASDSAWANYRRKLDEVKKVNDTLLSKYKKEKAAFDAEQKKRQALKDKAAKMRSDLAGCR